MERQMKQKKLQAINVSMALPMPQPPADLLDTVKSSENLFDILYAQQ